MSKNIKLVFLSLMLFILTLPSFAQHAIQGRVVNEDGEPLIYAQVVMLNPADSTLIYYDVADSKGLYEIDHIKAGQYLMQYSFAAKETLYEMITIPVKSGSTLGDTVMKPALTEEVVVTADYVPIQIEQDTVSFNARAFATKPDAVVEDLLKKIPGIEVDESGNMKALGEDVTKVLVDGKEFFGNDSKVATKNLPAKAIDKVQVYDKKSEEAEFMGVDDGVRDRTINLMLNEDHKKGYFGRAEAGGGTDSHYNAGGKLYRFSEKLQTAVLCMTNNVNEFGYTDERRREWGKETKGRNTSMAGGLNLSYNESKLKRYFFSYLGSSTQTDLNQQTVTENYLQRGIYIQNADYVNDERDTPHKINFGLRHHFNKKHNLVMDGDFTYTANNQTSITLTETLLNDSLVNHLDNQKEAGSDNLHFNVKGVDIFKLRGDDSQIKTDVRVVYNRSASDLEWANNTLIPNESIFNELQNQDNENDDLLMTFKPTWVQRLHPLWHLNASVETGLNNRNMSRHQWAAGQETLSADSLNADFDTRDTYFKPGLSIQRSTDKYRLNVSLDGRWSRFDKNLFDKFLGETDYFYLLPAVHFNSSYRQGRHIRFSYRTDVNMPSLTQLLPVSNTVNRLSIYEGNLYLKPELNHKASFSWWIFDYFSFTSLFIRASAGYTRDKISWSQVTDDNLLKTITPVNVNHEKNASSFIMFSTPLNAIGMKVDIHSRETVSQGISWIDGEENVQTNLVHSLGLTFENRRKQMVDVRIGGSVTVTDARFSIAESMNNVYINTRYHADFRYTPNDRLSVDTDFNVSNYDAESFADAVSVPILNASISYYFGKQKKTSLTLRGSDLLNQYIGFRRSTTANYVMRQEWNTLGRYVMLSMRWRIGV